MVCLAGATWPLKEKSFGSQNKTTSERNTLEFPNTLPSKHSNPGSSSPDSCQLLQWEDELSVCPSSCPNSWRSRLGMLQRERKSKMGTFLC